MDTAPHYSRCLIGIALLAATAGTSVAHAATVTVNAGDEQALINAIRGANQTNTVARIFVNGDEPFVFDTVDNTAMGPSFLPPIETKVLIVSSSLNDDQPIRFRRAEGAPDARFFYVTPQGDLDISRVDFENGRSPGDGGAIKSQGGLFLHGCLFMGNRAGGRGGAVFAEGFSQITGCRFSNNSAAADGGALSTRGTAMINSTILQDNTAEGFGGGADCAGGPDTLVRLVNTLFDGNRGTQGAGALHSNGCRVHMNNARVTQSDGDGAWFAGPTTINNSVFAANTPNDCQVFGPPPTRNHSWFSDASCGAGGTGVPIEPDLDSFYQSPLWREITALPFAGPDMGQPVLLPPAYREAIDSFGMTGSGSPDQPGTSETACAPIGLNGFPVVPPVAPCTPGVFQFPVPGAVPPNLSGHWYDSSFDGTGFNFLDLGDGSYRLELLGYGDNGAQFWQLNRGYAAGPFIVFPAPLGELPPGPVGEPRLADIVIDPVGCASDDPNELKLYPMHSNFRFALQPVPLTDICPFLRKDFQDGHSGGFTSADRPLDRFTLFILKRGEALFHWMTTDENGAPTWYLGLGQFDGDSIGFGELFVTSGPTFPEDYDPADLVLEPAGSATIAFSDCDNVTLSFEVPALDGAGAMALERDASLSGTTCTDG